MVWLVVAASLIVLGLAAYAAVLVGRLLAQRAVVRAAVAKRNQRLVDDIRYIGKAIVEDRCGVSEGAIRLCHLLPVLQTQEVINWAGYFPSLFALFDKVKDLPTHEARNTLPLKQRRSQDVQRWQHEQEFEQQIQVEASRLSEFVLNDYRRD